MARGCATFHYLPCRAISNGRFRSADIYDAVKNNKTSTNRKVTLDTALAHVVPMRGTIGEGRASAGQARRHACSAFRNPFNVDHAGNRPRRYVSMVRSQLRASPAHLFTRICARTTGEVLILSQRTEATAKRIAGDSARSLARRA